MSDIIHLPCDPVTGEFIETPIEEPILNNPYRGIASAPFSPEAVEVLMAPVNSDDIEVRPDGLIYLPEIKYRRILNRAFGPGAWSLLPMDITIASSDNMLYYRGSLFVHGRFVSEAIGEQQYYPSNDRMSYATAAESAKSNCLMRCCKDLGIASELWDPKFIRTWLPDNAVEVWVVNYGSKQGETGKKKKLWRLKDTPPIDMFPWREDNGTERDYRTTGAKGADSAKPPSPTMGEPAMVTEVQFRPAVTRAADPTTITFRQVKRFRAIAGEKGWANEDVVELLKRYDYDIAENIRRAEYDRICTDLEDRSKLVAIRGRKAA